MFARTRRALLAHGDTLQHAVKLSILRQVHRRGPCLLAVVVHLYYEDCWDEIVAHLAYIPVPFDVFVTLGEHNRDFRPEIDLPGVSVNVRIVENHGRDVLPFLTIAPALRDEGYQFVLKVHSKKSQYIGPRSARWFAESLDNLLPARRGAIDALWKLRKPTTGFIGPAGYNLGLAKWLGANGPKLKDLLVRAMGPHAAFEASGDLEQFIFPAGTMFWAPLAAIGPVVDLCLGVDEFEPESGQNDATTAHAVERLIGVVPTMLGRRNWSVSEHGITSLDEGEIPYFEDWATWAPVKSLNADIAATSLPKSHSD